MTPAPGQVCDIASGAYWESRRNGLWFPPGLYSIHTRWILGGEGTLGKFAVELKDQGSDWPPVRFGLFPSVERASELLVGCRRQAARVW